MMPKIVFVESARRMGGVQFSTLYLVQNLDRNLGEPLILLPGKGEFYDVCRELALPVNIINLPALISTSVRIGKDRRFPNPLAFIVNFFLILAGAFRLAHYLKHETADLIITKGMLSHFYGGIAGKVRRLPCLWHVQDFISERYFGIYRWIFNLAAAILADKLVVDGAPIADQIWHSLHSRIEVVLNGVDVSVFSPEISGADIRQSFGIPLDAIVIGNVARITPWKGQDHILRAFEAVAKQHSDCYLILVGSPVFDNDIFDLRLRHQREHLACRERVIFAGYRRDLPQVLNAFDIFVYTSLEKDTSPLSLLSALSCGLPTVGFDIPGVREVVGSDGLLVPVGDDSALSESLLKVVRDDSLRKDLALRARQKAVTQFSLACYSQNMARIIADLIRKNDQTGEVFIDD